VPWGTGCPQGHVDCVASGFSRKDVAAGRI
jgi:hypothetical protein